MSAINDGGPAFPVLERGGDGRLYCAGSGLSLRDYFAAAALPAIIAAASACQHDPFGRHADCKNIDDALARDAYLLADAMLAARSAPR